MTNEKEILRFKGSFNTVNIDRLLKELEFWSKDLALPIALSKKIYSIVVEVLTNIHHHSHFHNQDPLSSPYFSIYSEQNKIFIEAGNPLLNNEIDSLRQRIDILNQMHDSEIRNLYLTKVLETEISEKGGAGLGLITILKATREKIIYNFTPVNNTLSYFTMIIPINKNTSL